MAKETRSHVLDETLQRAKQERQAETTRAALASLKSGLKNARRTATRKLDEAGVPDHLQGKTEDEW